MSTSDIKRIEEVVDEYKYSMKRIVVCKTLFSNEEEVLIKESKEIANIICDDSEKSDILLVGHGSIFIIPGKHVIDDILNSNDSWSEKLKSKGIEITIGKKSLLQYEKIREMYIKRINKIIES